MPAWMVVALAPAALLVVVAGLRAPIRVLVAAYAFVLPFGSAVSLPVGLPSPFDTPSSLMGLVAMLGLLAHLVLEPRSAPRLLSAVPAWILFAGVVAMTFVWSVDPAATVREVWILFSLVALYVLVLLMPVDPGDVRRVEEAIVAGGAAAGLYGLLLLLGSGLGAGAGEATRFATAGGVGKGIDPNITAATLILPLAVALGRAVRATRPAARAAFWSAAALVGAAIILTGSRGGMLASIAVVTVHVASHRAMRLRAVVALSAAVALVGSLTYALAPAELRDRITRPGSSGRTDIWRTAMQRCDRYCLAGSGYGTFPTVYQDALHEEPAGRGMDLPFVAHSIWIGSLIETGALGVLLLVAALAMVLKDLWALPAEARASPLAGFAGLLVASTFLSTLGFKYFWMVMIYAGISTLAREREARPAPERRLLVTPSMVVRHA